ncbi:MAG: hypothetical protein R3B13_25835 [Polyangiaceae bacterium]
MALRAKFSVLTGVALVLSVSCSSDFDDKRRRTEPVASLGDDLYSAMCDRVGASVLTEDLSGASYHAVCHRDAFGNYADAVDESLLPPAVGGAGLARRLSVAKVHAIARRRGDLIQAFNQVFSDDPVPSPKGGTVRGHVALDAFLKRVVPLYDSNPIDKQGSGAREALMPSVTRAAGRLFASLAGPGKDKITKSVDPAKAQVAREALSRLSGRQGYRPARVALGALRPSLAYPELRQLTQTLGPRMGPGGAMRVQFQNVLGMAQNELGTSEQKGLTFPATFDPANPARPRTNLEVAQAIMLASDPAFAGSAAEPRYMVGRDVRGYAIPAGNIPGTAGSVPGPFYDGDGDGFADVDALGRFLGGSSGLAPVDPPFVVLGQPRQFPPDAFGRALGADGMPVYSYIDTSQTYTAAMLRDMEPLMDVDGSSEAIADLLSGAFVLFGTPVEKQAPWGVEGKYGSFDSSVSPMADLLHATGWTFAHKNSDLHLEFLKRLINENEPAVARVVGAALKVKAIADKYPNVGLDPSVTLWDEMAELLAVISKNPQLLKDLLRALYNPDVKAYIGNAYGKYNQFKDELHYDTNNLNGPPVNLTSGGGADPSVPADYTQPDAGTNRSEMHRILQLIHDVNGVNACNKPDAKVRLKAIGLPITWPVLGSGYGECELFAFRNMGIFYLHSILGKATLEIENNLLNDMMSVAQIFTDPDKMLADSAAIVGMGRKPTPQALDRLVFFGAESPKYEPFFSGKMPDRDANYTGKNDDTNKFISRLVDAVAPATCPERPINTAKYGTIWISDCSPSVKWTHNGEPGNPNELLRLRGKGTIFTWEKYEFFKGMKPLLKAFDDHGEAQLFLDLVEVMYRHWPSDQHGEECNNNGNFGERPWVKFLSDSDKAAHKINPAYNPRFCNGSGVSRYEPLLAEAFVSDLLPALGDLVDAIEKMTVDHPRIPNFKMAGLDIMAELSTAMFDPDYAAAVGMTDRQGSPSTAWSNGLITKPQLTNYDLFANALANIDKTLQPGSPRYVRWKAGRSKLVDQFLAVDGDGPNAQFRNRAFVKSVPILIDVLRAQLNANCPDRETSPIACKWATQGLVPGQPAVGMAAKAAETFGDPMFSTTMHLVDAINEDPEARAALQRHLRYLMQQASGNDALNSTLTSANDMMQLLGDDLNMPLIYNAIAVAAAPEEGTLDGKPAPGTADRVLELMDALTREVDSKGNPKVNSYDPYRIMDRVLQNLVSPMDPANPDSVTPLEIFIDTIAEVNRMDADVPREEPLSPEDMQAVFGTMRDFMASPTRGMEQLYEIMKHRDGD